MTLHELEQTTEHRPWKMPNTRWRFYQEWNKVLFLHYQVDLAELKTFVPKELEIDLFEGQAWVSVVAFSMEKIRPRNLPSFSPISNFDEINIRTYVTSKEKAGVYFLSIEGGNRLSCKIAKGLSELPYRYSKIKRTPQKYQAHNAVFNDQLYLDYRVGPKWTAKTALDRWLTERYALFQDTAESINSFEIHHLEWPLHQLELQQLTLQYPRFSRLLQQKPSKVHYSAGVKVLAWGKHKTLKAGYRAD